MSAQTIEQAEGYPTIHVWEQSGTGEKWACCAYDHGPMCRLCQRVDELLEGLIENCAEGNMLARAKPDGQFEFKMTIKGSAAAEDLIATKPEMADMWAQLQQKGGKPEITEVAESVLQAITEGHTKPSTLAEHTGLTQGQVLQALELLAEVGFIEW